MGGSTSYSLSLFAFLEIPADIFGCLLPGNANICPECGSDHVVQLAGQAAPCCSTPIRCSSRPDSEDDRLDITQSTRSANKVSLISKTSSPLSVLPLAQRCSKSYIFSMFSLYHDRRITQMPVLVAVLFWNLPSLQKIPPLLRLREAPSSSRRVKAIPAVFLTTQTATVKRIWLGVTTTPPSMVHHLKSSPNLQKEPPRMVGICTCVKKCEKTV